MADARDTGAEGGQWLMRGSVRRMEIDGLATAGELDQAISWRKTLPPDDAAEDLLAALAGSGRNAETAVRQDDRRVRRTRHPEPDRGGTRPRRREGTGSRRDGRPRDPRLGASTRGIGPR